MSLSHETFDGGLVTARDPATLSPGEVSRAINCIYRPSSPGLWKAPGRVSVNSAALSASAKGLRYMRFETGNGTPLEVLIAHISAEYQSTTFSAETGLTFASLRTAVGTGATLEAVHYNNRYYLLNGNTDGVANVVAKISETTGLVTTRQHGLAEVTQVPTLALATGEGWPNTTDFGTGYYFFFYTEVVNPDGPDEIESALGNDVVPKSISVPNFTDGVTVTLPATKDNSTATHRRIYIVGPKESSIWNPFFLIEAREIALIDIAQTSIIFGLNATSTTLESKAPTSTAGSAGWTNPNNVFTARDGNLASADYNGRTLLMSTFGFVGGYTAIQGIEVVINYNGIPPAGTAIVELSWDAGASWTAPVQVPIADELTVLLRTATVGGRNYRWGRTWAAGEFSNANFRARITTQGTQTGTLKIDYVQVNLYTGASTGTEPIKTSYYPTTSVKIGPTVTVLSSNTPPPVASTGDIFEAQYVLNDVTKGATIRWSRVDEPDYFPSIYTLTFPCSDKVTVIRRINNVLLVGMQQHIWRVNFLPNSVDNSFETGRCYEPLAEDHGIISTQGYAFFAPDGMSAQLAYVSATGLRYTNGLTTSTLTEDIDWGNTVNITKLDKCILVNDPNQFNLIFYYIPAGDNSSTSPTRAMYLSYHSSKIKAEGKLAVAGPVTVNVASSTIGFINKLPIHLTGSSAGTISVEDRGAGSAEVDIVTRDIYSDAIGGSLRARAHWLRFASHDPGVTVIITPYLKNSGRDYYTPADNGQWTRKTFRNNVVDRIPGDTLTPRNTAGLARLAGDFSCESFALRIQSEQISGQAVGDLAITAYGYDAKSQGEKEV